MSKRGRNSKQSNTRKKIVYSLKTKIRHDSFRDPFWAETICMNTWTELRDFGYSEYGEFFSTTFIPDLDRGYVTSDSRGRGCMQ